MRTYEATLLGGYHTYLKKLLQASCLQTKACSTRIILSFMVAKLELFRLPGCHLLNKLWAAGLQGKQRRARTSAARSHSCEVHGRPAGGCAAL